MQRTQATHWPRVLILWLCGIFAAMQFSKISFAFVALQQVYATTPFTMGLVLSTVGMVGLVFGVTVGVFAPAIGYQRLLVGGLGLGSVLAAAQSLMPALPLFWLTRVLEGASHLAVVVAAPTLIAASCGPQHRSIAMGLWSTFVGVAFALTSGVGGWLVSRYGLNGFFGLHAAGMGLMAVLAWLVLRERQDVTDELSGSVPIAAWPRLSDLPQRHVATYTSWVTALPGLCFFCYTAMAVALLTFLPQVAGQGKPWLAVTLPLLSIGGNFSAGWLAQHWVKPTLLVRLAFAGVGVCAIVLGACLVRDWYAAQAAMLLMFIAGLAGGAAFSLIPHLTREVSLQARANGAVAQLGNLGSTMGPPLFAVLISQLGGWGVTMPVVLFALLGLALATWGAVSAAKQGAV